MSRFLPPVIRSQSCCIDSQDLRFHTEPDGRQLYTYTVTWHDVQPFEQSDATDHDGLIASPQFSFMDVLAKIVVSRKRDLSKEEIQICKRIAPINIPSPGIRECRCDGPCGKIKPVNEMHIMGLCDHYICQNCFERAPAVKTAHGFGCPNVNCYQTDLAYLYANSHRFLRDAQDISNKSLRRTTTNDKSEQSIVPAKVKSRPCLCLVEVRLTTFTPLQNSDKICRRQQIVEIYGDYTMLQAINILKQYERLSSLNIANHLYYCLNGLINERTSWKHIREEDLLMPITKFGQEGRRIDIIFDFTTN